MYIHTYNLLEKLQLHKEILMVNGQITKNKNNMNNYCNVT